MVVLINNMFLLLLYIESVIEIRDNIFLSLLQPLHPNC